jgi:UrcA family protein
MNIVKSTTYRLVAVSSLVAVLCAAQAPAADRSDSLRSQTVSYRDLNLNTIEGATILYQRIRGAASTVCGGDAGRRLEEWQAYNGCFKHAIAQAVVKVNSPMLTAVHNGGKPSSSVTAMLSK